MINRSLAVSSKLEERKQGRRRREREKKERGETRAYRVRRRRRRFRTDNKFPTKVSRFNVDKVVVPATRCPALEFLKPARDTYNTSPALPFLHGPRGIPRIERWPRISMARRGGGERREGGAEVRVLALSARNYVRGNFGILCMAFRCRSMPTPSVPSYAEK